MVFVDIDGVLAPIRRWDRYGDLNPACIQVLNEIVARGGADVVVSSTLRHGKTVAELQAMLEAQGFIGCVLDKTPSGTSGAGRGEEIADWLADAGLRPGGDSGSFLQWFALSTTQRTAAATASTMPSAHRLGIRAFAPLASRSAPGCRGASR